MWSKVCKNLTIRRSRRDAMKEQDEVVSYISKQSDHHGFNFVVTRPGSLVWDRQSQTKLAASKSVSEIEIARSLGQLNFVDIVFSTSHKYFPHYFDPKQPGPFPITNVDLAEFSLNALKSEKLYNTSPYVVPDK